MTSDREFADFLHSLPRDQSEQDVADHEEQHDAERGPYVPHEHHAYYEESRH